LKKPAIVFAILSVYIISAFAWWTYAHIKNVKEVYDLKASNLDLLPYKAALDLKENQEQELFVDSNSIKKYFYFNYPQLEIRFDPENDPMYNYMILVNKDAAAAIEQEYKRKVRMYALEGVVMVLLLFWGILWIYNNLRTRLNLKKQQGNFLLSITHELKTPLASIKLYLETLLKRPNLDRQQVETMMRNSLGDVTRLRDLVDNLLTAAQLDSHNFSLSFSAVDISALFTDVAEKFVLPRNLQHRLSLNLMPNAVVYGDQVALEMVATNLISNAFKYSAENQPVSVSLFIEDNQIRITVADQGVGISADDKKSLFDKFYRAEDENIRKTKGTGLGLFIVKNLLNLHHATILVNDNSPSGSIFEILIPKHVTQNITS
jgi:two-component system phosphate regulon sensor histidine kinase PhoR